MGHLPENGSGKSNLIIALVKYKVRLFLMGTFINISTKLLLKLEGPSLFLKLQG